MEVISIPETIPRGDLEVLDLLPKFQKSPSQCISTGGTRGFHVYIWLDSSEFAHEAVNHQETYVRQDTEGSPVHTNGCENVWSLFKRGIVGVFHKVSAKYLPLYLNEFEFRFNNRDNYNLMDSVLKLCF